MSKKKKLAALGVTALMMGSIASGLVSHADNPRSLDSKDVLIVAKGLEKTTKGKAYKIIEANWENDQPKAPQFTWDSNIADWVRENYPDYIGENNSVTPKFNDALGDKGELNELKRPKDNGAASFYDKLAAFIQSGKAKLDATEIQSSGDSAQMTGNMGGYLILFNNDMRVYRPSVVSVYPTETEHGWELASSVEVTVKSSVAPLTKESNKKDVSMGDEFTYTINANIPVYPASTKNKVFNIYDKFSKGISLKENSIEVYGVKDGKTEEVKLTKGDQYKDAELTGKHESDTIGLAFDYDKIKDFDKIKVTYVATLNENATVGEANANSANVVFNNDPYNETSKTDGENTTTADVHTYGLDLEKTNAEKQKLSGASFSISNGKDTIQLMKDEDGSYHVYNPLTDGTGEGSRPVTEAEVNSEGKLLIKGLATGEYTITEQKAPNGYVKLQAPLTVKIVDADNDGVVDENAAASKGYVALSVVNDKGFTWPVTGGNGSVILAGAGTVVIAAGVFGIYYSKRKQHNA